MAVRNASNITLQTVVYEPEDIRLFSHKDNE